MLPAATNHLVRRTRFGDEGREIPLRRSGAGVVDRGFELGSTSAAASKRSTARIVIWRCDSGDDSGPAAVAPAVVWPAATRCPCGPRVTTTAATILVTTSTAA